MPETWQFEIAGLSIPLQNPRPILDELRNTYADFQLRADKFKSDQKNPHLCRAGCSHCCKSGAAFAVTLAEAVQWSLAIANLPAAHHRQATDQATKLLNQQHQAFPQVEGPPDTPGRRSEPLFSARVTKLNATSPACPLLVDDLCSVYENRPMLCRAYGFPVDAFAVESAGTIVFRSLCVLYEGMQLSDYVRAKHLKSRLTDLSLRLAGGRDVGRFTSAEAILATINKSSNGTATDA